MDAARRSCLSVLTAAVALLAVPAIASAATTIGIPTTQLIGTGTNVNLSCGTSCTYAQFRGPVSSLTLNPSFVAPASGVIVRWRLGSGSAGNPITLRVLRPLGFATSLTGAGTGTTRTTASGVTTYENEHLRIRQGDTIGLNDANSQLLFRATGDNADVVGLYQPAIPDTSASSATFHVNNLLQLNADVEADADGDGFGDETQDACPNGAALQVPCADLSISKTASSTTFTPGQDLSYTLAVKNSGARPASNAIVSDKLPTGASLVSATSTAGPCTGTGTVSCSLGNLAVGGTATITVVIRPPAVASITNTASVTNALPDPNPANNSSTVTVRDQTKPSVSGVGASPKTSRLGSVLPKLARRRRPPVGTTISWQLSEPASTTISFGQTSKGRKKGSRCIVGRHTGKRCTVLAIRGRLIVSGKAGKNKLKFQGRLSKKMKLSPGKYTVLVSARDAAGNRSSTRSTTITLVR